MIDSSEMVKKVFTQKSGRIETNKGDKFYSSLSSFVLFFSQNVKL